MGPFKPLATIYYHDVRGVPGMRLIATQYDTERRQPLRQLHARPWRISSQFSSSDMQEEEGV